MMLFITDGCVRVNTNVARHFTYYQCLHKERVYWPTTLWKVLVTGSIDAMQRVDATKRFVILLSINVSLFLRNMSMANSGHRHTESKRDQSSASPVLCTISGRKGACSHSYRKKKEEQRVISERWGILRLPGSAKFLTLKMEAKGFDKGKNMGLRARHNFVAEPEIVGWTVMARRISCLCEGCSLRFQRPVHQRYLNPAMTASIGQCTLGGMIGQKSLSKKGKTATLTI